jgi:small-conductance mechanosensitive channel
MLLVPVSACVKKLGLPSAALLLLSVLFATSPVVSAQGPVTDDEVVQYLDQTVSWYRDLSAAEQSPAQLREVLFSDNVRQSSAQVLRLAFDFARTYAAISSTKRPGNAAPEDNGSRNLIQAEANADQRLQQIQSQIDEINRQIQNASARLRPGLVARRETLVGALNLTKSRRDVLHSLRALPTGSEDSGLARKISDLERSVPEASSVQQQKAPSDSAAARAASPQDFHAESAGLVGLTTEIFSVSGRMSRLDRLAHETDDLLQANQKLRVPLRTALQDIISRGDAISQTPETADPPQMSSERKELDALLARFKQLSGATTPLVQQVAHLNTSSSNLTQWRGTLAEEYSTDLQYLLLRLGMLAFAIFVIFLFSELWRRGTMRYVHDLRRRRQLLLLRRIVVGCTIALFVILSFVTEVGSVATFTGFLAAGLAVALQSLILSVVAYFFLSGRWGVRVGDRVTVSGVTGDVFDVGLFRLYLMELGGAGHDLHATGRIVVFPNAVFFQPTAMFKQIPGIHYTWRTVTLTLAPDSDYALAEKRLFAIIESVYAEYRDTIERQHQAAYSSINLQTPAPQPESRVRFVDSGLEFTFRYPVEIRRASETDNRITTELMKVIENEPRLRLADGSTPKIQALV